MIEKWYENGQLEVECFYKNGEPDGVCKDCWESGEIKADRFYKDGKEIK